MCPACESGTAVDVLSRVEPRSNRSLVRGEASNFLALAPSSFILWLLIIAFLLQYSHADSTVLARHRIAETLGPIRCHVCVQMEVVGCVSFALGVVGLVVHHDSLQLISSS